MFVCGWCDGSRKCPLTCVGRQEVEQIRSDELKHQGDELERKGGTKGLSEMGFEGLRGAKLIGE